MAILSVGVIVIVVVAWTFISDKNSERKLEERVQSSGISSRSLAYEKTGFDLKKENKSEDAERAFLRAIEFDPKNQKQAYLGLAELYRFYMPEKYFKTPELLRSGLSYDPQDIILLRALAQYYERTKDISNARYWYGQIINYYPNDIPAKQKIEELGG
ncbi:MAG: hypothetical protein HYV65_00915 [Candidatus Spechtbacteria bacterium]|nr:hypothetical protein [Candidatus Spechtbacteria bacterium]